MNKKQKQQKPQSLVGRQVYFKMSKKRCKKLEVVFFTPNKLYKIKATFDENLATVLSDNNVLVSVLIGKDKSGKPWCAHLCSDTHWILKRAPSSNG